MILEDFSWQQFLVAAMVFSLVWFAVFGLLYVKGGLKGTKSRTSDDFEPLPHGWQNGVDELDSPGGDDLMGKPALGHGVHVLEADEFSFAPLQGNEPVTDPADGQADVQEEIRGICRILEMEDGNKDDFISLFSIVRSKFPLLAGSGGIPELNDFIREQVPFFLSEDELDNLWA